MLVVQATVADDEPTPAAETALIAVGGSEALTVALQSVKPPMSAIMARLFKVVTVLCSERKA